MATRIERPKGVAAEFKQVDASKLEMVNLVVEEKQAEVKGCKLKNLIFTGIWDVQGKRILCHKWSTWLQQGCHRN